jgi:SnoaL-like domain
MTPEGLQSWLDDYVAAWRSFDPAAIGALFTEDATYAYHPWDTGDEVVRGRDAIVANWREDEGDDDGKWVADYRGGLVAGDRCTAVGTTKYSDGTVFWNLWELRFDGDRCAEFVEWYMKRPEPKAA